jgi:hypothetical protein
LIAPVRKAAAEASAFIDLLWLLAPERNDLVALLQSFFDESYGPDGLVCVAGYVFTKSRAQALDKAWRKMLDDWELPYFRMSACAHGNEPFDTLCKDDRIKVEKEAIALVHRHALHGVAATVDPVDLANVAKGHQVGSFSTTPYEFCAWNCIGLIAGWARAKRPGVTHSISYVFESGDAHQREANAMMDHVSKDPDKREFCMYAGHAFFPKEQARPTQAADLLAWQWFTDSKRRTKLPYTPRKDLIALMGGSVVHTTVHADQDYLAEMVNNLTLSRTGNAIARRLSGTSP